MTTVKISESNNKLGKIPSFSIPSGTSCPGASSWCLSKCYAEKISRIYKNVSNAYHVNLAASKEDGFEDAMNSELAKLSKKKKNIFRIHVSGDFYSLAYIDKWANIITANPSITFYAYTRSWAVSELVDKLETLRTLPNMTLFASTDASMTQAPPSTWRVAYAGDSNDPNYLPCLEQHNEKISSCDQCKLCFNPALKNSTKVNIYFSTH